MTAEELFKIWNAWREIEKLRERVQTLSAAVVSTTKIIDGVPIGTVKNGGDKVGKLSAEISQVMEMSERRIMELHRQAKKKLQSLTA